MSIGEMSIVEMSNVEMSVGEMSRYHHDHRLDMRCDEDWPVAEALSPNKPKHHLRLCSETV